MKNKKVTFLGLSSWRDILQEIRIKEITDDQIIFYPGLKRKTEKYQLVNFSGFVILDGWNKGLDSNRIFRKIDGKFQIVTRMIYDETEAFQNFQDLLKQIDEKKLQADILQHKAGTFSRNIP